MLYKVEGIVIRTMDYGEGDKIITLFTELNGKVGVMARGAKKVKSRHAAVTQLFTYGVYTYYKGSGMASLNDGEIIQSFYPLRSDIMKTAYSAYIVEWLDRVLDEKDASAYLFFQLKGALVAIEQDKDPQIISHLFELKMLQITGYTPVFNGCISCGVSSNLHHFSPDSGGVLCSTCSPTHEHLIILTDKTLKLLRLFQKMDLTNVGSIQVSDESKNQLKHLFRSFIDSHVSLRWKSRHFLDQMDSFH